ncbi:MAG: alpha/beta fold hydrolase [Actinomycetales bacterium]
MSEQAVRLSVELHGRELSADVPVLVLGPSLGTTAAMWHPVLPYLQDVRVAIYSLRGHGGSQTPPGPYTLDDLVADVVGVMEQLSLPRAHQVGVSLGGMVALGLATTRPDLVESVVPVASSAHPRNRDQWLQRAAEVRAHGMAAVADSSLQRWFTDDFQSDPEARTAHQNLLAVEAEGYAGCCEALADIDLRQQVTGIEVPALVLAGEQDPAFGPEHAEALRGSLPGARLTVIEHSAHLPPTQQPRAVADALRDFLGLPAIT